MPKCEILHSGQYWQDVRRRAKNRKAERELAEAQAETFNPSFSDAPTVLTFVPGRTEPFASIVLSSGHLQPVPTKSTSQSQDNPDLLKRLAAGRAKRRREAEDATAERARKRRLVSYGHLKILRHC